MEIRDVPQIPQVEPIDQAPQPSMAIHDDFIGCDIITPSSIPATTGI